MNKLILALTFLLAPFFSQADLWDLVDVKPPKIDRGYAFDCGVGASHYYAKLGSLTSQTNDLQTLHGMCIPLMEAHITQRINSERASDSCFSGVGSFTSTWTGSWYNVSASHQYKDWRGACSDTATGSDTVISTPILTDLRTCPHDDYPEYTQPRFDNEDDPEMVTSCFNPETANLLDSCKANSGYLYISVPVTVESGCYALPDGSICKYDAVDIGGGNQAYSMDLEGDCYTDELPDIDGDEEDVPADENDNCTAWGTGLICPENPDDVCSDDAQGNRSCPEGCGTMNGVFACIDNDTDSDGIPDYLDPDVDGDGIKNEDDLDSDGDGKDDPIDNSKGNGSTTVNVDVDMSGVISKLEEIRKGQNETSVELKKKPTPELAGFWESQYEEGVSGMFEEKMTEIKATPLFKVMGDFNPSMGSGSAPPMSFCFNFGAGMNLGCSTLKLDPRVIPFIKMFLLIVAAFTARRIIFGG